MFVFLSKFLPALIYPLNLTFVLILAALIFRRKDRLRNTLLGCALAVIFICGNPLPCAFLVHRIENSYQPFDGGQRADAIVVLGGCTESKAYPRPTVEVNGAGDRILYGITLYQAGLSDTILVGGSYIDWRDTQSVVDGSISSPASEMRELALTFGVPESAVLVQDQSLNTYEESVLDAEILRERGMETILLVTSASHMRRSVPLFEKQGLTVIPAPTDYSYSEDQWRQLTQINAKNAFSYIVPSIGNMRALETVLKEYLGYYVYKLRGWI